MGCMLMYLYTIIIKYMCLIPIPFSSLCFSLIKCLWSDRFLWGERNDVSLNINCSLNISLFPTGEYISSQNRSYVSSHTVNSFNCHTTRPTLHGSHSRSLAKTINFYVKKKKFAFRYLEKKKKTLIKAIYFAFPSILPELHWV